ncbi:tRNA (adenosine(37)-N6)-threonylcarbamoyltransferase complex ATPase subunit type 1 TsaE [Puniceibacterium sediminis]|uniref:tRNA threonylcarbamoyladenosine biosynthesis protein TsaE n=1 Tax=Puniceibacterium sediminis TaxID=1608407 RepID=A0A238YFZ1_9RHOB|nr:tRNA (adenosine(37)-N6)-threonylcarbamoyltransferase complex ATPase subunit type 1 TsaE [Puniceibacterium sediminis]SNR70125.1 tRNA threonylcarbamoyladenosine biosynthesis protein TsaE [Puniceibacterium sediminis]
MAQGHECAADREDGSLSVACKTLAETAILAEVIAEVLTPGDVILLDGALAAGKTTFVTLMCQALGCEDQPSSPTYAISNIYTCPGFEVFHIDAYRLSGVREFYNLGIEEFFPEAVALIEWGERVREAFPDHLQTSITFQDPESEARVYTFNAEGSRWETGITDLARRLSKKGLTK